MAATRTTYNSDKITAFSGTREEGDRGRVVGVVGSREENIINRGIARRLYKIRPF